MKKWKLKSSKPVFESKWLTIKSNDYELPAGWVNKDETSENAALRELKEETGYTGNATFLGTIYPQPGFSSMLAHIVEIELNENIEKRDLESDEEIEFELMSMDKVDSMIRENLFKDMGMLSALNLFKLRRRD